MQNVARCTRCGCPRPRRRPARPRACAPASPHRVPGSRLHLRGMDSEPRVSPPHVSEWRSGVPGQERLRRGPQRDTALRALVLLLRKPPPRERPAGRLRLFPAPPRASAPSRSPMVEAQPLRAKGKGAVGVRLQPPWPGRGRTVSCLKNQTPRETYTTGVFIRGARHQVTESHAAWEVGTDAVSAPAQGGGRGEPGATLIERAEPGGTQREAAACRGSRGSPSLRRGARQLMHF